MKLRFTRLKNGIHGDPMVSKVLTANQNPSLNTVFYSHVHSIAKYH